MREIINNGRTIASFAYCFWEGRCVQHSCSLSSASVLDAVVGTRDYASLRYGIHRLHTAGHPLLPPNVPEAIAVGRRRPFTLHGLPRAVVSHVNCRHSKWPASAAWSGVCSSQGQPWSCASTKQCNSDHLRPRCHNFEPRMSGG